MDFPVKPKNYRYFTPEVIDVEPDAFTQATQMSAAYTDEALGWRTYLNVLGLLAFQQWLQDRLPHTSIVSSPGANLSQPFITLGVNEFKYCLIITEDDSVERDTILLPCTVINSPENTAHFYVFLEVLEEAEQVIISGFIRYDQLTQYSLLHQGESYQLQKFNLDQEPNHLLLYTRYLKPGTIQLPNSVKATSITKLRDWLRGLFEEHWQTLDQLLNPPPSSGEFAFRGGQASQTIPTKNIPVIRRGKLLESSLEYHPDKIALVIGLTPTDSPQVNVTVEVSAVMPQTKLPDNLQLMLLDERGNIVMQAQANQPPKAETIKLLFSGELGDRFTVQVILNAVSFTEVFEI
jgi:hypothetical protein